ncbi:MAG TPA: methyltransferase domain-containing protein [Stellaceae bacterium]|nr:methyltransferase domain-containing protein [Stellaceae bacterium]
MSEGMLDPNRPVGAESRKTYAVKIANGFFDRYLSGKAILEIGYKGGLDGVVPIVPQAIGIDVDYPGYDGTKLPFPDESQDAVYSSHCLEHIKDYQNAIREWFRVVKIGGYLVIIVPHQHLFERKRDLPSRNNLDHKRFYTPASLLREVEEALPEPNSYRIRHLMDNDMGFDYSVTPLQAGVGCFEIELVLQRIKEPVWDLDDGASRNYNASEFFTHLERRNIFFLETDFSAPDACQIYGPYVPLAKGDYEVQYFFEAIGIGDQELESEITFDVAQDIGRRRIALVTLLGPHGNKVMRDGMVSLRFANDTPESLFEFRVFKFGRPFQGTLRFYGVSLERLWLTS